MMAGNPSWWSMVPPSQQPSTLLSSSPSPHLFPPQYLLGSSSLPLNSLPDNQELPQSWSQLLLGGDEDRFGGLSHNLQPKKLENWEGQILTPSPTPTPRFPVAAEVKQDVSACSNFNSHGNEEFQAPSSRPAAAWSPAAMVISSPKSCVTSLSSSNVLEFSNKNNPDGRNQHPDQSPDCNSTATGGASKKARVQPTSSQPPIKVRKEKLGDRITALHQLVSPFGKTDTASVLLEAIGYIRFLEGQIQALSSPYMGTASSNMRKQQSVQGERSSVFPEDPSQYGQDEPKDLRSRGLCLVPLSCTPHVGSENGADYWAPAAIGGGF